MMDKEAQLVAGYLGLIFIMSFAFHIFYAEGKAFDIYVAQQEKIHDVDNGSHGEEEHH